MLDKAKRRIGEMVNKHSLLTTGFLAAVALTLGLVAVGILGYQTPILALVEPLGEECGTACLFGVVEPLDPIGGGGILFKGGPGPRVEPLGDPCCGGIIF